MPNLACVSWACGSAQGFPERLLLHGLISVEELQYSGPSSGTKFDQNTVWSPSSLAPLQLLSCSFCIHQVISLRPLITTELLEESVLHKGGLRCQCPSLEKVSTQPLSLDMLGCRLWQPLSTVPARLSTGVNSNVCSPAWVRLALWKAAFPAAARSFGVYPELWSSKIFFSFSGRYISAYKPVISNPV